MALLYGLRYFGSEVLESMLTDEMLPESSCYLKILNKGIAQGHSKGYLRGERQLLRPLLEQKFGPLSEPTDARLQAAPKSDLERWAARILTATTLDEALS